MMKNLIKMQCEVFEAAFKKNKFSLSFHFTSPAKRKRSLSFLRALCWMWQSSRANLWVNINFHHHRPELKAVPGLRQR